MEKIIMFIVWHVLPYKLRYWTVIRAAADATSGKWGNIEPSTVTAFEVLDRMK
jgi:hypothetical protein